MDKADGSDAAVYPELARANLLRMRGDYKAAEDQCLAILRRYPNNETANVLLGDICFEKGEVEQAMQWYEMALDLAPEDQAAKHKLELARTRFKEQEAATTAEQLMLPTTKSRAGVYAIALIASILVIAIVAYFVGIDVAQRKASSTASEIQLPISAGNEPSVTPTPGGTRPAGAGDDSLTQTIRGRGQDGTRVISAVQDPRDKRITITFSVLDNEDTRLMAASIASETFSALSDAFVLTLRAHKRGQLIYTADAFRSKYEETLSNGWRATNGQGLEVAAAYFIVNEWPSAPAPTAPPPQETPPGEPVQEEPIETEPPPQVEPAEPEPVIPDTGGETGQLPPGEGQ